MNLEAVLGRFAELPIRRIGTPGAFLALDPADRTPSAPTLLLPGGELSTGTAIGDVLTVFIYLDSQGRPVATLREPKLTLGEVAFLRVTSCTGIGAFVDWGLSKELLVPFAEQTKELHPGEVQPVGLYVDSSGRLAGTMRVSEMLNLRAPSFAPDAWVDGEAWRDDPNIGLFVIVERAFVGLVPKSEPHALARGEAASFRVSNVLPDGKLVLSLRGHAHEERESDGHTILSVLARPNPPRVGDASSPEQIRALFGLSKKAFKRAAGGLLKRGEASLDAEGCLVPSRPAARASTPRTPKS